jgi:hypothetical protein
MMELVLYLALLNINLQDQFFPGYQYLPSPEQGQEAVPIPRADYPDPEPVLYA